MSEKPVNFAMFSNAGLPLKQFKAGEAIFKEGDPASELYCVESGRVGIHCGDRLVSTVEANGIFGQMALIDDRPRVDTAIAETDVALAAIPREAFLFCVAETPSFSLKVMREIARRMRAQISAAPGGSAAPVEDPVDFSIFRNAGLPEKSFRAGDAIIKVGDPVTELYCVEKGRVAIHFGERLLQYIEPGDIFGIVALVEHRPSAVTAVAATDVTVTALSEKAFLFCVAEAPDFSLKVMRAMGRRLRAQLTSI